MDSKLSEIARVPPWIESVASRHTIPEHTRFAMDLCLEEALSNIIRHGYGGEAGHAIVIRYLTNQGGFLTLIVEDVAPPFNPVAVQDLPSPRSPEETLVGGQGIRLLKEFADVLEYERSPAGNRLILRFVLSETSRGAV